MCRRRLPLPTPRQALEVILTDYEALPDPGEAGWISIVACGADGPGIQYVEGSVNLLHKEMDLSDLLRRAGENALAEDVGPARLVGLGRKENRTLWHVLSPTPTKVATILDVAFEYGHELGPDYEIEAKFDARSSARPGPLSEKPWRLGLAGWLLLAASLMAIVLVAFVIGPWALDRLGPSRWRTMFLVFVPVLAIPGLLAGICVYLVGRRLLARIGISTSRD